MPFDILDYHINRVLVPEWKIGYIIGTHNHTRRLLKKKHNVHIYLLEKSEDGSYYTDLLGNKVISVIISSKNYCLTNNVINCKNEIENMMLKLENSNRYTGCDNCITKSMCNKNNKEYINVYESVCNICNKITN